MSIPLPESERKMAPVQGWPQGIPWSLHLEAYAAYCKKWRITPTLLQSANCTKDARYDRPRSTRRQDMTDIVERLRCFSKNTPWAIEDRVVLKEAADEITSLRTERDQLRQYLDAAQRRGEELRAQVAALEVLLDDAIEEIEGWGEYAPACFKQKHDLEGTLARFRAARKEAA